MPSPRRGATSSSPGQSRTAQPTCVALGTEPISLIPSPVRAPQAPAYCARHLFRPFRAFCSSEPQPRAARRGCATTLCPGLILFRPFGAKAIIYKVWMCTKRTRWNRNKDEIASFNWQLATTAPFRVIRVFRGSALHPQGWLGKTPLGRIANCEFLFIRHTARRMTNRATTMKATIPITGEKCGGGA